VLLRSCTPLGLRSAWRRGCTTTPAQLGPAVDALMAQIKAGFDIPLYTNPMPIQDAIDLAVFLTQTAIGFSRFRAGSPTVGGPIETAAITKHDGFKWIRHKQYYDTQLNPYP
jgi:hypothetical protein